MSSLIFYTSDDEIILAMDTLAVADHAGTPLHFTTKFYPVPHLNGVICGTGSGPFTADWFFKVNTGMVVDDMPHLDHHTPAALRKSWPEWKKKHAEPITTTIYHFGLPCNGGPACAYAYRSEKNFASESLQRGLAVKPAADVPTAYELPRDFGRMMLSQRAHQAKEPIGKRIHIGGQVWVCHLTRSGLAIYATDTFPDHDEHRAVMFAEIAKARGKV